MASKIDKDDRDQEDYDKGEQIQDYVVEEDDTAEAKDVTFESLGLVPELCEACTKMGFKRPTKIQRESIPWALKGNDLVYVQYEKVTKCRS